MRTQLTHLMRQMNLTAARFADIIGVQRSSISHIMSGRNQPSYDFILKILDKFPDVNAEWLITGKGDMQKARFVPANEGEMHANDMHDNSSGKKETEEQGLEPKGVDMTDRDEKHEYGQDNDNVEVTNVNSIDCILVLYHDKTFEQYGPRKKG